MTAKRYLSQVYWLEMQVESKLMQEKELRSLAERVGMSMDRTAGTRGGNPSGREEIYIKLVEAVRELDRKIDELVDKKREIQGVIEQVEDDDCRLVLEHKYLNFLTIEQIAEKMHYSERWVKDKCRQGEEAVEARMER